MLELAARQSQLEQAASKLNGLVITIIIFAAVVSLAFFWLRGLQSEYRD